MKIAIVGAPGSGKSELAVALEQRLDGKTKIIDNYVEEIGREADLAPGISASYIGNLFFIVGRYGRERKAWGCNCFDHTITCGSLIESSVYATMNTMAQDDEGHESSNWTRITNFMNLLGSFFQDTMSADGYDHVFVTSLKNPDTSTVDGQVDKNLFMALNAFGIPYTPLSGTTEEKTEQMMNAIERDDDTEDTD